VTGQHLSAEVVREIEAVVHERGALSKAEILDCWGFDEESYAALKSTLLSRRKVTPGAQKTGGFAARGTRAPVPDEASGRPVLREAWEEAVVARLMELLQHKDLEDLLGPLAATVRHARAARPGGARRCRSARHQGRAGDRARDPARHRPARLRPRAGGDRESLPGRGPEALAPRQVGGDRLRASRAPAA
jgi:hypothetical protein